jgi:hypothetical protein
MADERIALILRHFQRFTDEQAVMRPQLRLDNSARGWHHGPTCSNGGRNLMKQFFLKFFTWWSSQTFGTQLWTWRFGELVGTDDQGNRYYRTKGGVIDPTLGFERRWVIYNG